MRYQISKILPALCLTVFLIIVCFNHATAAWDPNGGPAIGIITYLPLDETSSGSYADIYNGNYGPLNGICPGDCPSPVAGYVNGAQQFNGTSSNIDIPYDPAFDWVPRTSTSPDLNEDSFTIEFWMNKSTACAGTTASHNNVIVGRDGTGGNLNHWWVGVNCNTSDTQGVVKFNLIDSSGTKAVFSTTNVIDGGWHHIVAVRDGVTRQNHIYVDGGDPEGTAGQAYTAGFDATTPINIGYINLSSSPGYFYDGIVDEISIYNRALSKDEISFHYSQGSCGRPIRIMPVGDSITKGSGDCQNPDSYYNCVGYRGPLWEELTKNGYNADFVGDQGGRFQSQYAHDNNHLGYGGDTPSGIDSVITDRLNTFKPDVVLLHIGTNNTGQASYVKSILDKIDAYEDSPGGNVVTVVLAQIVNRKSYDSGTTTFNNWIGDQTNIVSKPIGPGIEIGDVILVDMEDNIGLDYTNDFVDNLHPNASGYLKMAWEGTDSWYNALETFLSVCGPITPTPPVIYSTPVTTAYVGVEYVYDVNASGYPTPLYSLDVFPSGMQIYAGGVIRWTPGGTGQETVRVIAANGELPDAQQEFTIDVMEAPDCPPGMVHCWDLNDADGSPYEDSVGGKPAACSGDTCPSPATGQVGSAVDFDGDDELATQGTSNPTSGITVMAWINPDDLSDGIDKGLVFKEDVFLLELESDQNYTPDFSVMVNGGTHLEYVPSGSPVPIGEWSYIVGTYDGTTVRLYMNGSEIGTGLAGSGTLDSNSNPYVIGYSEFLQPIQQRYFFGKIDEVAVFDRALSLSEIQALYAKGVAGNPYCDSAPPGPTSFSDDFSSDTRDDYGKEFFWGTSSSFLWDDSEERAQILTGNDQGIRISHPLTPSDCGTFSMDFLPTVEYPDNGWVLVRLIQDANNYWDVWKTSGGPETFGIIKFENGVQDTDVGFFLNNYTQNQNYHISISFSPNSITADFGGEVLNITDSNDIVVNKFEIEIGQQDAYLDNFQFTSCAPPAVAPVITSTPVVTATVGELYAYDVNATGTSPITYALTVQPFGMAISSTTGQINWTPSASDEGSVSVTVEASNSVDTDTQNYSILVSAPEPLDFGDAPDPNYPTLLASNGARHTIVAGTYLGASVDEETDGQPTAGAVGDDNDGNDDEDGVLFTSTLEQGLDTTVNVTASVAGKLNAWIDLNSDGDWTDPGEQIFTDQTLTPGTNNLGFSVPFSATVGQTFARFRFDTVGGLSPTGIASDGEVEDYAVQIDEGIPPPCPTGVWPLGDITASGNAGTIQSVTYCGSTYTPGFDLINGTTKLYNNSDVEVTSGYPAPGADDFSFDQTVHTTDGATVYYLQTIFGGLYDTFFVFENGGNDDATWYGVRSDDTLTTGIWVDASATAADTGSTTGIGTQALKGFVFKTQEPVKGIRILPGNSLGVPNSSIGFDAYSISALDSVIVPTEIDLGDAPDPSYPTLLASDGARHTIVAGTYLGASVDAEPDGQPTALADGDDLNGVVPDDEDGVVFTSTLEQGLDTTVDVTASVAGKLNAWIDLNSDGDWTDLGEQIFTDEALTAGTNNLDFSVPFSATVGQTFVRFRFDTAGGLSFTGLASDGEVEDYAVQIEAGALPLPDADFDDDGDVDAMDLLTIAGEMAAPPCTGSSCECDMNGDEVVNGDDLGLFAAEYGSSD